MYENLLTNLESKFRPLYEKSIKETNLQLGRTEFFIKDKAFDGDGKIVPNFNSLHTVTTKNDDLCNEIVLLFLEIHRKFRIYRICNSGKNKYILSKIRDFNKYLKK